MSPVFDISMKRLEYKKYQIIYIETFDFKLFFRSFLFDFLNTLYNTFFHILKNNEIKAYI